MTTKNWPLLIRVAEYILDNPQRWYQGAWISECGTAGCFAGWATFLSGYKPIKDDGEHVRGADGEIREVEALAIDLLGIQPRIHGLDLDAECNQLFEGSNDINDILGILRDWADQDGITLPERLTKFYQLEAIYDPENDRYKIIEFQELAL